MRHSCLFRSVSGLLGSISILVYAAVACSVSSCTDDTFNKYQQENTGLLTFDVKVPGNWTNGLSRAATDISIRRMSQSDHAEPLYLVTEISEVAADAAASDAAAKEAATRGSTVNSTDDFHTNFGLSAICYTGTWPDGNQTDWHTDFAHNLKVSKSETSWKLEEEKKLNWLGSGRIRFFAYSPHSATNENGITHSAPNQGGIPTLTYTVPTDVTKQQDLMIAMEDCPGGQGGAVKLNFKHALTAVTIKTGSAMLEGKITKVTFKGVYGAGTHQIGSDQWTTTGAPIEFSVGDLDIDLEKETPNEPTTKDENNADATVGSDGGIVDYAKPGTEIIGGELTFLMIPQKLPKDATLEIEYQDKLTRTSRTLTAKLGEKEEIWPMGKKVVYSISSTGIIVGPPTVDLKIDHHGIWMNGIEPTAAEQNAYLPVSGYLRDVQLAAYTRVTQAEEATKIIDFSSSVEIEYSTNGGSDWTLITKDNGGWLPATPTQADISALANEDDPIPYVHGSILLPAQEAFQDLREKAAKHTDGAFNLDMIGNNNSAEGYHDLVENNPVAKESANCYVINRPGYYKFPTWYGNTYNNSDNSAYTYHGSTSTLDKYILRKFVGHDDLAIDGTRPILGIKNAVLVWQDSPDLVTDIKYEGGWVYFYMPKEAFNQGNSVIAVRNEDDTILWSWHIWATYCDLNKIQESKAVNEKGMNFQFLRYNLGYCDPRKGNEQRPIKIRFYATMPNGTRQQITNVSVTVGGNPITKGEDGVLTFTQPAIIESIAGDNTYFQWGRKDPMLPGVYNQEILRKAPLVDGFLPEGEWKYPYTDKGDGTPWVDYKEELDIVNKEFYSTTEYKFHSEDCGRTIGESIKMPYRFFIHRRPGISINTDPTYDDKNGTQNYLRRHWHNGEVNTSYQRKTIMNFWNSQLDQDGPKGKAESPNDKYVIKTIYDPSPAGYKIPPPTAFSKFAKPNATGPPYSGAMPNDNLTDFKDTGIGWEIREQEDGELFFFPSTGVRDMGIHHRGVEYGTFPAHSKMTYIASSGFQDTGNASSSCLLFSIDSRTAVKTKKTQVGILYGTNNSYGFTLRPIRDHRE